MRTAVVVGLLLATGCAARPPAVSEPIKPATTGSSTASAPARVAITLDDLGATVESADPELSARILKALGAQAAPVAVFVNCVHLRDDALALWQHAGATIGNHTTTHLSLDAAGPDDAWWNDVKSCDDRLRRNLGEPVRFFRFPYLRYGKTAEFHEHAAQRLSDLGYRVAHVTAATSEWLVAGYYETALARGDAGLAQDLAAAYVEHMVDSLQAAHDLAVRKTGHDVAQITLAHVNRLAGDHLSDVLSALQSRGWHFISLEEALRDPVYAQPDAYVGGCGCSWLARIAPALTRDAPYVFGDYEDRLRTRFEPRVSSLR